MSRLSRVFEPIRIGRVTVPNRIVRTAHGSFLARREILQATRATTGAGYPIGIRLSDQYMADGIDAIECAEVVRRLEAEGLIDFINGSQGSYHCYNTTPVMVPTMERPLGSMIPSSSVVVSGATRSPRLLTAARVRTLEEAEQILRDGLADLVGMNRAFIADPEVVNKTRDERVEEVRPCIACNQGCVGGLGSAAGQLGCAVNPAVGFELQLDESLITRTTQPKKVLVIGGGPAGLEAARIAALKGHRVILAEAAPTLGGLAAVARRAPTMHTFGDIVDWLQREVYRLGVEARTGTYMKAADALAEQPDAVIVATGGLPRLDGAQAAYPDQPATGADLPHVISAVDLLTGAYTHLGTHALVFDDVGRYEAVAAADALIAKGVAVTFATRCEHFAPTVDGWLRAAPALERLQKGDFRVLPRTRLLAIRPGECTVQPFQCAREETVRADTVVLVLMRQSLGTLRDELEGKVSMLALVGDALAPRDLQAAMREGHKAARAIH